MDTKVTFPADQNAKEGVQPRQGRPPALGEIGLRNFAPYLMNRIMGRYNRSLREVLAKAGLSIPKVRTLVVLSVIDGLMVSELAVYTVLEQSTLSRTLDALEAEKLIRREAPARDTRMRHIFITKEGREAFDAMWPYMREAYEALFAGVPDDERTRFVATLQTLLKNVRKHEI
jgi:DNA-binding MarR family transcriptional regulator